MGIGSHFGLSDKVNNSEKKQNPRKILWHQCQCSGSSQIPSKNDLNNYHQFLSLYKVMWNLGITELAIFNTENGKEEIKILNTHVIIDQSASITQLPNGDIFCYCKNGIALIIDRSYKIRMLTSGTSCRYSSVLYFNSNIYCFGGINKAKIALSRKLDLEKKLWINLTSLPEADFICHSVIFERNILISGHQSKSLWLYSVEIDSFSVINYEFASRKRKVLINVEKLYLIEWGCNGLIYESEDEYNWISISKSGYLHKCYQMYCLYNKEKIYISSSNGYYQFDLKKKVLLKFEV